MPIGGGAGKLCNSNGVHSAFTGEGYRKGKRSAVVDHHQRNKQHGILFAQMEKSFRKVALVSGQAQRLANKIAIVTGAGGGHGLGFACAKVLAHEGAQVVAVDIDEAAALHSAQRLRLEGCQATAFQCDTTMQEDCESLVAAVLTAFHRIDILVSSPGASSTSSPTSSHSQQLEGAMLCGYFVGRQMAQQQQTVWNTGAIVNLIGTETEAAGGELSLLYATKSIESLTRCMALSLAPYGLRVNGMVPSAATQTGSNNTNSAKHDVTSVPSSTSSTPLGRLGEFLEFAQVVSFLVSDAASFMTGQTLNVDGGRAALDNGKGSLSSWDHRLQADWRRLWDVNEAVDSIPDQHETCVTNTFPQ